VVLGGIGAVGTVVATACSSGESRFGGDFVSIKVIDTPSF
jgi:hypothetical protein